jgi:very-short-patch-repair endonuclease
MEIHKLKPRKALNKAFLKVKPNRTEIEGFKANLIQLLDRTNDTESEEFHKNLVIDFLKKTYYDPNHFINTKGRNDLVIHNGDKAKSTVGVIIEAKKPTNKSEMVTTDKLNAKAFQELVLYYLRERITQNNLETKHLIITNINEWFIFDATTFDRLFAQNKKLVKQFQDFEGGRLADTKTDFFYKQIAEPFISEIKSEIEFTYFNLQDYQKPLRNEDKADDNKLIALFKLLSPEHLLKLPFTNDSNSLDKRFYSELLHIIGLTETKEGSKKLIERNKAGERNTGTILEDAIIQLDSLDKLSRLERPSQFGSTQQEKLFNVALELSITWINRILFLKLLEAQLITYHKGDKSYSFLNLDKIKNYDDLNSLFFQVLARKYDERNEDVIIAFEKVPYLNSSLFEPTDIEQDTLFISNLRDDKTIPIISSTVLKDQNGKKRTGKLNTLEYLFEFLNAYDFSSEGSEEIQEENKSLINASVLGLIFEKINGYKDGSFFTPGFITMYMCRETIRKAVVQKFNEAANKSPLERGFRGVSNGNKSNSRRKIIPYNPKLKELAHKLRNNSTKSEIILWKELKGKFAGKYDFHRQKPLDNYIADFFCYELKLVIEIDGESHDWEETQQKDFKKESRLNELGLNVLRFPDSDIFKHLDATLETIRQYIIGFENGDLFELQYEESPLNLLSGNPGILETHPQPLSRGEFKSLDDVYEQIGDDRLFTRQQANEIVNSLKICDPAVGSGHFLVSALNEMIAVKNDLKILQDRDGKRLKEYQVVVVNDELIVTDEEGELFDYNPNSKERQRIQETLFHEKQTIIENCLFGVDINPNSVKICRLRLWIELLKNAYYKNATELETLPNIDINIKCGNSLVSRFDIDADLKQALKKSKWSIDSYRVAVDTYRNAQNKEQKREMERLIDDIKSDFRSEISLNDPKVKRLRKLSGELFQLTNQGQLFEMSKKEKTAWNKKVKKLTEQTNKLEAEIEEIKGNKIFVDAFEWRFEFPEVLNDDGDFVGFDIVIGNPPYIQQRKSKGNTKLLSKWYNVYSGTADLSVFFFERAFSILRNNGQFAFISTNKFFSTEYGKPLRNYLSEYRFHELVNFELVPIFDEALVSSTILHLAKTNVTDSFKLVEFKSEPINQKIFNEKLIEPKLLDHSVLQSSSWMFSKVKEQGVLEKIRSSSTKIGDISHIQIKRGITTGYDKAFIVDTENEVFNSPLSKPFLRGKDIHQFQITQNNLRLLFIPWHFPHENDDTILGARQECEYDFEKNYPSEFAHLLSFKPELSNRNKSETGIRYEWYALQRCAASYYRLFDEEKIVWGLISGDWDFALDQEKHLLTSASFFLTTNDLSLKTLLGIFNSSVFRFQFSLVGEKTAGGAYVFKKTTIEKLLLVHPFS